MKKIFKILIPFILLFILLFSMFGFSSNNFLCSFALNSLSTRTVNFYDNDDLLYSINVDVGTSLSDLENSNILKNSNFADSTSTAWYEANSNTTLTYLDNGGLIIAGTSGSGYVGQHFINPTNYYGLNISFSISINDNIFSSSGVVPNGYNGNGTSNSRILSITNVYDSTAVGVYIRPSGSIFCQFGVTSGNQYIVNWVKVEVGTSSTPYFSKEYISKLYRNENNLDSSDTIYWSTSQSYGQYDFNTPITQNINLYGNSQLNNLVNFYGQDRITLLYSDIVPYGSKLKDFVNISDLKNLYFNNQSEYTNINDFDLVFTDNYYSYNNYFNLEYIILNDTNIYCSALFNNYTNIDSSNYSLFYDNSNGNNLLNKISIDSIKFDVVEFLALDSTPFITYKFRTQIEGVPLDKFSYYSFTDNYNNTYYYKLYGYLDNTLYCYDSYLYRINCLSPENIYFYPLPVPLFDNLTWYLNDAYTYSLGSCEYMVKFNIDYNMQYYYADYFGIGFIPPGDITNLTYYDTQNRAYLLGNYNYGTPAFLYGIKSDYLLNSYINSFSYNFTFDSISAFPLRLPNNYDSIQSNVPEFSFLSEKIYFYQTNNESNGNNIIPTDSNGLYKDKQNWWDFGTDIYNIFIYIIFDAPIISNISQIIYIVVALIIQTILTIINLFSSVSSTIFIAMILGFVLLKFVFKKFLGGSD